MSSQVAEVVAVIRAEDGGFKKGMREAKQEVSLAEQKSRAANREQERQLNVVAAGLAKVRFGWLGVAAAAAGTFSLMGRSPVAQVNREIRDIHLARIGHTLYEGTGARQVDENVNNFLGRTSANLEEARELGAGNIFTGLGIQAFQHAGERQVDAIQFQDKFTRARAEGRERSEGTSGAAAFNEVVGGAGQVVAGLGWGLVGGEADAAALIARGASRVGGAIGPRDRNPGEERARLLERSGAMSDPFKQSLDLSGQRIEVTHRHIVEGLNNPELERKMRELLEQHTRSQVAGGVTI